MNSTTGNGYHTTDDLASGLRVWAAGDCAHEAIVELLIGHDHWLRRRSFTDSFMTWSDDGRTVYPELEAATACLDAGDLPCSTSEKIVLRIAAALAGVETSVRLSWLNQLDDENARLVAEAVWVVCGRPKLTHPPLQMGS